jgi:predicted anti-sigma-YlaC factor YlaD
MDCAEFLESYSDYLDQRFEVYPQSEYCHHLGGCRPCGEYDRVVRRGLALFRQLEPPDTTPDFVSSLRSSVSQDRFQHADVPSMWVSSLATLSAAVLIAVAVAPLLSGRAGSVQLPPVVIEAPQDAGASLWGPTPRLAPRSNLLLAPSLSVDPLRVLPSGRPSLFRAPLRATDRDRPSSEPSESEDSSAE